MLTVVFFSPGHVHEWFTILHQKQAQIPFTGQWDQGTASVWPSHKMTPLSCPHDETVHERIECTVYMHCVSTTC